MFKFINVYLNGFMWHSFLECVKITQSIIKPVSHGELWAVHLFTERSELSCWVIGVRCVPFDSGHLQKIQFSDGHEPAPRCTDYQPRRPEDLARSSYRTYCVVLPIKVHDTRRTYKPSQDRTAYNKKKKKTEWKITSTLLHMDMSHFDFCCYLDLYNL